jgi:hypothetical protein
VVGCKNELEASGELDRLVAALVRHCDRMMIRSDMAAARIACTRIGGPLLFRRLWKRLGIAEVLAALLADRGFGFAVERAVFVSVLHRLLVSGSDRSCEKWMADYQIAGIAELQLHHFCRAMAWLGEEIAPAATGALAPRCIKDEIEERLFTRRRDLFGDLSLVLLDTTSLSFCGAGGESLGAYGHSKEACSKKLLRSIARSSSFLVLRRAYLEILDIIGRALAHEWCGVALRRHGLGLRLTTISIWLTRNS